MKPKSSIAALAALMAVSLSLTACGNNRDNSASSSSGASSGSSSSSGSSAMDASSSGSMTDSDAAGVGDTGISGSGASSGGDTLGGDIEDTVTGLSKAVEDAVEWTALTAVTDASIFTDTLGLDRDNPNYEEISVKQAAMSAAFGEIIVIKAKDVDEAVKDLENHRDKMAADSLYPEHQELAKKAVIGKRGDYAYLIANEKGADAEKALHEAIDKL